MIPLDPSISWLEAFPILPLLALNNMIQPVGRVLGISVFHSVWLRASPITCALDVLGFTFRLLTYCALLHATPRKAMLIIGMDRFDEAEIDHGVRKTMIFATIVRVFGFFGTLLLTYVVGAWGGISWTVTWAWMYAASYVVLEIASQLARRELSKPHTPADFELDEVAEDPDDGEISYADSTEETADVANDRARPLKDETQTKPAGSASTKYKPGRTNSEVGSLHDEDDVSPVDLEDFTAALASTKYPYLLYPYLRGEAMEGDQRIKDDGDSSTLAQAESSIKVNRAGRMQDDIDDSTLAQAETTEPTNESNPSNLEAAKNSKSKYADPVTSPRLPILQHALARMDVILLRWGCLFHVIFLYWAFLDLIQPSLNRHILSSRSWETPLFYLSLPFIFACLFLTLIVGLIIGFFIWILVQALVAIVNLCLPTSIQQGASAVVTIVFIGLGAIGWWVSWGHVGYAIMRLLASDYMLWVYKLISMEVVVLLIFLLICFGLYNLLLLATKKSMGMKEKLGVSRYLEWDGVALLTSVIVTFTVSILWYRFRYASSAHWVQDWRDALVVNTTVTNSTMTNTTTTSDFV